MSLEASDAEVRLAAIADQLALDIAARYRVDASFAAVALHHAFLADPDLRRHAEEMPETARIRRTRAFKAVFARVKADIYNDLRRYRRDDDAFAAGTVRLHALADGGAHVDDPRVRAAGDAIAALHVSTRERLPDLAAFDDALAALLPAPSSLLDLGCGVHPILAPAPLRAVPTVALDRDAVALEALGAWARFVPALRVRKWALADGFAGVSAPDGGPFDLALALKFVPVVARQERESLGVLRDVPARRLLVTGAREAMVKRRDIAGREEKALRDFAEAAGFAIAGRFEIPSEMGFLLERA